MGLTSWEVAVGGPECICIPWSWFTGNPHVAVSASATTGSRPHQGRPSLLGMA